VFSASVRVCAPVLERRLAVSPPAGTKAGPTAERGSPEDRWSGLWAQATGVPPPPLDTGRTLGQLATVAAGFRDQYYGLVDLVRENDDADEPGAVAPLVTSGAIDWGGCSWGRRPIRFAKRWWRAPVVDLGRLAVGGSVAARRWVDRTCHPKIVVATQTRVVEAAVDPEGTWVPSVPALAVIPEHSDDLWRLAAVLASPAATAWLMRRAAGTALARRAVKVAGPDLVALPLPRDDAAWDAATAALRHLVVAPGPGRLDGYLAAASAAYRTPDTLTSWWRAQAGPVADVPGAAGERLGSGRVGHQGPIDWTRDRPIGLA
jgi:hypothetical protein